MSFDRSTYRAVADHPEVRTIGTSPQRDTFLAALKVECDARYPDLLDCSIVPGSADGPTKLRVAHAHPAGSESRRRDVGCDMSRYGWRFVWADGDCVGQYLGPVGNLGRAASTVADALGLKTDE